jgi:bacterioferritin
MRWLHTYARRFASSPSVLSFVPDRAAGSREPDVRTACLAVSHPVVKRVVFRKTVNVEKQSKSWAEELQGRVALLGDGETEDMMAKDQRHSDEKTAPAFTREQLITALNEDLAREYQAIIAYVVYSQVLKGAEYMTIATELEKHAGQELQHALIISKLVDYLGGEPTVLPKSVKTSSKPRDLLRFDLQNENETVRNYRERVRQAESLGEFAIAEHLREILKQEQEHQIDLATALGENVPDVSKMKG